MIRVKDESGQIIKGLHKDKYGNLIVSDLSEYNKYKQQQEVINQLNNKIDNLTSIVERLQKMIETDYHK